MKHEVQGTVGIRLVPSLGMQLRRGFYCCGIANPKGLSACPSCGTPAAPFEDFDAAEVVATWPWPVNWLFKISDLLVKLAKRIERWGHG